MGVGVFLCGDFYAVALMDPHWHIHIYIIYISVVDQQPFVHISERSCLICANSSQTGFVVH